MDLVTGLILEIKVYSSSKGEASLLCYALGIFSFWTHLNMLKQATFSPY